VLAAIALAIFAARPANSRQFLALAKFVPELLVVICVVVCCVVVGCVCPAELGLPPPHPAARTASPATRAATAIPDLIETLFPMLASSPSIATRTTRPYSFTRRVSRPRTP